MESSELSTFYCPHDPIPEFYVLIMVLYIDQTVAKFPHKAFPVIDEKQDYQSIHNICTLLYGNSSTLTMMLGGGNHNHIGIAKRETLHAKITPMPNDAPVYPVGTATVPLQATTAQLFQLRYRHT